MKNKLFRKGLIVGIIVLIIGVSIIPSSGFQIKKNIIKLNDKSDILYVGGNGSGNYSKIQDAIDNANEGDTVFVFSGLYMEDIKVNKSINLIGQEKNSTIIDPGQDKTVIRIKKDNVKISDFTIRNSYLGISYENGINVIKVKNIEITNCKIIWNEMEGIWIVSSQNISIYNNIINSNDHYGINSYDSNNIYIIDNEISNNPVHGICAGGSNIFIDNNNISSNGDCGIILGGKSPKIINNVITKNNADGIYLSGGANANITGNIILNNDEKGILIKSGNNATISNNIIMGNNDDYLNTEDGGGICIFGSNDNLITRNIVKYNTHEEIYLSGALRTQIIYNEINSGWMENLFMTNCFYSEVSKNNFRIENDNKVVVVFSKWVDLNDFFNTLYKLNSLVTFNQNYWDRPRLFPKAIKSSCKFKFGSPDDPGFSLKVPFLIFDKNPASEPYDI